MNVIKQQTVTYCSSELVSLLHKIDEVKNPYYLEVDWYVYTVFSSIRTGFWKAKEKKTLNPKWYKCMAAVESVELKKCMQEIDVYLRGTNHCLC